ncbi:hypothetical protein CC80DRAFT_509722 [Byssothecium circinans]|uniref:Uncharacterized protein n=1 Tax=Byssothecium circinans TaxID=147558 RepID=A0A6A5THU6_9PLEO|nr:hypothetical protein CC80DRAFT_509722 [Byssothecium circinans]
MPVGRPRARSLHIPIPKPASWRARRPPTPRRATYPPPVEASDAPPVPSVSYWETDTPEPLTSPLSPLNPFLSPPRRRSSVMELQFTTAVQLLPASPLSVFDRVISPSTPSFIVPRKHSLVLSPRFLYPRTPPVPPLVQSQIKGVGKEIRVDAMRGRRHLASPCAATATMAGLEEMHYQSMHEVLVAVRDQVLLEMEIAKKKVAKEAGEESKDGDKLREERLVRTTAKAGEKEWKRLLRGKRFKSVREEVVTS